MPEMGTLRTQIGVFLWGRALYRQCGNAAAKQHRGPSGRRQILGDRA